MKKIFTLVAAALMVAGLNAQEVGQIDPEALGLTGEAAAYTAGTVLAETPSIVMTIGADDNYKSNSGSANDMVAAVIGEATLDLNKGAQGNSNPKNIDGANCDATATVPASGAFTALEAKKDGYVYFFHKASSNKTYLVGEEGSLIGYQFAAHMPGQAWGDILAYTLEGNETIDGIQYVTDPALLIWPEKIFNPDAEDVKTSGVGVIAFPVYNGCKYTVNACGSKIMNAGFIFTEAKMDVKLANTAGEQIVLLAAGTDALESNVATVVSSRYYLLSGEEVAAPQAGNTGLYIVKNIMSDGSVNVSKVVLK